MQWLSAIGSLVSTIYKFVLLGGAYALGRRGEENRQLRKNVEAKDEQLKIANRPSASRDDLLDRMRDRSRK